MASGKSGSIWASLGLKTEEFQKGVNKAKGNMNGFKKDAGNFSKDIKKMFLAAFSFQAAKGFVGELISIRGEFQKFEAVLTNTLGSGSEAENALLMIQRFAAKTPFQVKELTDSFVKLANQGFKPTMDEMRSLGDLAASTGKGFDQLAEAVIDAQTGEFERLKEFGIRAEKQGDKVTFAFKGVKTQVDFTSDSITNYINGLGNAEGVSGSMAAISETLEGKISNLKDTWDDYLNTLGKDSQGIISGITDKLTSMLSAISEVDKLDFDAHKLGFDRGLFQDLKNSEKAIVDFSRNIKEAAFNFGQNTENVDKLKNAIKFYGNEALKSNNGTKEGTAKMIAYKQAMEVLTDRLNKVTTATSQDNAVKSKNVELTKEQIKLNKAKEGLDFSVSNVSSKGLKLKPSETPTFAIQQGIEALPSLFDNAMASLESRVNRTKTAMVNSANAINSAFANIAIEGLATFGAALGTAFAGGDVMQIGMQFSSMIADAIGGLGKNLIEIGIVMTGIMDVLSKGGFANPALLIGGGIALVALSSAMKGMMGNSVGFADGGLVTGSVFANVGEGIGTNSANPEVIAPLDKLKNFINPDSGGMGGGNVSFRIEGNTLVGILDRQSKTTKYSR
jgi:hypothetical protein